MAFKRNKFLFFCLCNIFFLSNPQAQEPVLTTADWMPYFAGCENISRELSRSKDKRACADANLAKYLLKNVIFPDSAREKGIRGTVYVSFIIRKSGEVADVKILNDIGGGCGIVAKRAVEKMPFWEAAIHKEQKVDVQLTVPIKFEIDEGAEAQKSCQIYWADLRYDVISISKLKSYADNKILVRDDKGEFYPVIKFMMTYENGKRFRQKTSKGERVSEEMMRMLKKMKPGGTLTLTTTLQKKGVFFELHRSFSLIP